jgi:uncharacterized protein
MYQKQAVFRFYEELNDHLSKDRKKKEFIYSFNGNPTIKDVIEAIGIPHVEVDLILVNGQSVDFKYKLQHNDFVSVYPVFELIDISDAIRLREGPLRITKFVLDVHLGKLTKFLRLLGFDSLYRNDYSDPEIIEISLNEKRIILTRDLGILKNEKVAHGYWLRSQDSKEQLQEVLKKFDLYSKINPFSRCIICNGKLKEISKTQVINKLEPRTMQFYDEFFQCITCKRIYWEGSHFFKLKNFIEDILQ